jgi:hypothetical protein
MPYLKLDAANKQLLAKEKFDAGSFTFHFNDRNLITKTACIVHCESLPIFLK